MSNAALKIKTEALPSSRIAVQLEVPAERCQASFEQALSRLSKSVKLPGFRKGKVPKAVIIQQIGLEQVRATALESLLENVWNEALKLESIEPLCEPELQGGFKPLLENFKPSEDLTFTLETDIAPIPELKATKGLEVEAEKVVFNAKQIDELIEQSRKQLATLVPVESRAAAIGDVAVLNFHGKYSDDNSDIKGGKADSMDIDLEEGRMIPGFVEGVVGMKINDQKTLKCQFPDDYQEEEARGRQANFSVTLKDLKTRELPKLDDDFAKQASDKSNMAELREELEKRLQDDADRRYKKNRSEALIAGLVKELEVELPQTLINEEVRNLVEQTASNFAQQGMDVKSMFTPELVKSLMESSQEEAKENLRRNLALSALAKAENISIEEKAIEDKFKEVSMQLSNEKNIDLNKLRRVVADDLLEEKLIKWLEENNTVIETEPKKDNSNKKNIDEEKPSKNKKEKKKT